MKEIANKIGSERILTLITLAAFILIKIPPYTIPGSPISTAVLMRLMIIFAIFLYVFAKYKKLKHKTISRVEKQFVIFLTLASISSIAASELGSFVNVYENIIFAGLFIFVASKTLTYNMLSTTIIATALINSIYQIVLVIFPSIAKETVYTLLTYSHAQLVDINLARGRLFIETYDEIAIAFILFQIPQANSRTRFILLSALITIIAISILSNNRTRVVMAIFALASSFVFTKSKKINAGLISIVVAISFISIVISTMLFNFSLVDRLLLSHQREDVNSLQTRWNQIKDSIHIGATYPITGVGLGNFQAATTPIVSNTSLFEEFNIETRFASQAPHNLLAQITAEMGILSGSLLIILLLYYARKDINELKNPTKRKASLVISFWTLVIYGIFNPALSLTYIVLFWLLRSKSMESIKLKSS